MSAQSNHTVWTAYLSETAGQIEVGDGLVLNAAGDGYILSTLANRTAAGRRTAGLAITPGDGESDRAVELQFCGVIPASTTGLGAGAVGLVSVSATTGRLERGATGDIVGFCDADGVAYLMFGSLLVTGGPGGDVGESQFHDTGGVFGGTPKFTIDVTTKEPSFNDTPIHYPGTYGKTIATAFDAQVTNATEPATIASLPVRTTAHAGLVQVVAQARYASGKGTQIYTVPYTLAGGTLTLGTAIDQTPSELVDATCVLTFATRDVSGVDYIDVKASANGDTNWSGQVQITMTDTP